MTKTEATKVFNKLEKIGCNVITMNSNRYTPAGSRGLPDHIIMHAKSGSIIFIEDKLTPSDRLHGKQIEIAESLIEISMKNPKIGYFINTGDNINEILEEVTKMLYSEEIQ